MSATTARAGTTAEHGRLIAAVLKVEIFKTQWLYATVLGTRTWRGKQQVGAKIFAGARSVFAPHAESPAYCHRQIATNCCTAAIGDYDSAANGLQVENSGNVTRIAATVDASLATVKLAIKPRRFVDYASRLVLVAVAPVDEGKI
jgi:hypothetical protein